MAEASAHRGSREKNRLFRRSYGDPSRTSQGRVANKVRGSSRSLSLAEEPREKIVGKDQIIMRVLRGLVIGGLGECDVGVEDNRICEASGFLWSIVQS